MKHSRDDYNRIQDPDGKIPEDEPVFLLRAQDRHASFAVRAWARAVEEDGGDPAIVKAARDHAEAMDEWSVKKRPDLAGVATDGDLVIESGEVVIKRDGVVTARIASA